ncbi:MAG: GTP 3',8-cyclase MoaA [Candidatus Methanospirare jalkutatii]|nr:MAG: GTP 3',8-cyclase MoaA [Candidatus Methanospirare jalkutatii]
MSVQGKLIDAFGREITSLRFALTRRCNLNCIYCHAEGEERGGGDASKEISADLVVKVAKVASQRFSVRKVKFSGGEPLLRGDLAEIIQRIRAYEDEISLTTNGTLLREKASELADAGLDRVNVSLDTLNPEKYDFITRTRGNLSKVIDGIYAAVDANLTPVKLNMVLLKGINDEEIWEMMDFVRDFNGRNGKDALILQLIELMPFFGIYSSHRSHAYEHLRTRTRSRGGEGVAEEWVAEGKGKEAEDKRGGSKGSGGKGKEAYERYERYERVDFSKIEEMLRSKAKAVAVRALQRRRKYFLDGLTVEVVRPMDNSAFCMHCKRLRITSDGKIKPCLLRNDNLVPLCEDEDCIAEKLMYAMQIRKPFYMPKEKKQKT